MVSVRGNSMARFEKAKVFISGRSQAVRIPAKYRFSTNEVYIRRDPRNGDLILSPVPSLREIFAAFDRLALPEGFLSAAERSQELPQERGADFLRFLESAPKLPPKPEDL
jgi:antitoxin VapB